MGYHWVRRHKRKNRKMHAVKTHMNKKKIAYLRPFGKSKEVVTGIGKRML